MPLLPRSQPPAYDPPAAIYLPTALALLAVIYQPQSTIVPPLCALESALVCLVGANGVLPGPSQANPLAAVAAACSSHFGARVLRGVFAGRRHEHSPSLSYLDRRLPRHPKHRSIARAPARAPSRYARTTFLVLLLGVEQHGPSTAAYAADTLARARFERSAANEAHLCSYRPSTRGAVQLDQRAQVEEQCQLAARRPMPAGVVRRALQRFQHHAPVRTTPTSAPIACSLLPAVSLHDADDWPRVDPSTPTSSWAPFPCRSATSLP